MVAVLQCRGLRRFGKPAAGRKIAHRLGATDDIEQKHIAVRIQETALADVLYVPLGRYVTNSAWRSNVSGVLKSNQPVMWNISKS